MTTRDRLLAAARCWELAGFYEAAAERFATAEAWRDAGRCLSLAKRHTDAAIAYSRAGESLLEARQLLVGSWPERARPLLKELRSSRFLESKEKVEVLLGLGELETALHAVFTSVDQEALKILNDLSTIRGRPDLTAILGSRANRALPGCWAPWNRSAPAASQKETRNWPSVEFSDVTLVPLWKTEERDFMWGDSALDWSADSKSFVALFGEHGLGRGRVSSEGIRFDYLKLKTTASCARFLPGSQFVLIGMPNGELWRVDEHCCAQVVDDIRLANEVGSIAFSSDGNQVALVDSRYPGVTLRVQTWHEGRWEVELEETHEPENNCAPLAAWASNRLLVWSPGPANQPNHLHFSDGQILRAHDNVITSLSFTFDGGLLITGSGDCTVAVRSGKNGQLVGSPRKFDFPVLGTAAHPQAGLIAIGEGHFLHLFRLDQQGQIHQPLPLVEMAFADGGVCSLAFSPNGHYLLVMTGIEGPSETIKAGHLHLFRVDLKP